MEKINRELQQRRDTMFTVDKDMTEQAERDSSVTWPAQDSSDDDFEECEDIIDCVGCAGCNNRGIDHYSHMSIRFYDRRGHRYSLNYKNDDLFVLDVESESCAKILTRKKLVEYIEYNVSLCYANAYYILCWICSRE